MQIGFIGLGIMGSRMAANLVRGGTAVTVYNRTAERTRPLSEAGARVATSASDAARDADVVITVLSDPEAVRQVAVGEGGFLSAMRAGSLWVDCSTVDPAFVREMAAAAAEHGVRYLDAPVAGSKVPAERGELLFLVGGVAEDVAQAEPLFSVMGKRTIHAGSVGSGASLKLCNNLMLGAAMLAFGEAVAAGRAMGLDEEILLEALTTSPVSAPFLSLKRNKVRDADWAVEFPLKHQHKDLHLLLETAYAAGLPLPLAATAKERYGDARAHGLGEVDFSAVCAVTRPPM
jgi:3-hydroxyisobutyrate dehydrogenase/glyoxylate/succinic semialdehyde reductase